LPRCAKRNKNRIRSCSLLEKIFFIPGAAYNAVGRYEEAIKTLKEAHVRDPKFLGPYLFLAVAYVRSGREEEARGEVAEILRLNPHFSVEGVRARLSSQDPAKNERLVNDLRKAGLK
jgi:adenylate cyclase